MNISETSSGKRKYSKENRRQQYQRNKQRISELNKAYYQTIHGTITKLLNAAKERSRKLDCEFDLDYDWLEDKLQPMVCEATGLKLSLEMNRQGYTRHPYRPSIDRIDNSLGYTKDNCRVVAVIYNYAKSEFTDKDVLLMAVSLLEKIYEHI